MCRRPPRTPTRAPRCGMTGPAPAWTGTPPTSPRSSPGQPGKPFAPSTAAWPHGGPGCPYQGHNGSDHQVQPSPVTKSRRSGAAPLARLWPVATRRSWQSALQRNSLLLAAGHRVTTGCAHADPTCGPSAALSPGPIGPRRPARRPGQVPSFITGTPRRHSRLVPLGRPSGRAQHAPPGAVQQHTDPAMVYSPEPPPHQVSDPASVQHWSAYPRTAGPRPGPPLA